MIYLLNPSDDNTFKSQYGQGNPRRAPRQHQNKTGMEIVGLKAQLQSNLFEDLEYQKVKVTLKHYFKFYFLKVILFFHFIPNIFILLLFPSLFF